MKIKITTNKKAKEIIKNYVVKDGFIDISETPKDMSLIDHARIIIIQNDLHRIEANKEYYLEHEKNSWLTAKIMSSKYQSIVYKHWDV